jgi:dCTP deaminase
MYLSDRDLRWALERGQLLVLPYPGRPGQIGPTSIDLHLDRVDQAKVWDLAKFRRRNQLQGLGAAPELRIGTFSYPEFAGEFQMSPREDEADLVFRRGQEVVVKPGGFLLWQTKEMVGTPEDGAQLICFIDGKSTRARTGLVVHLTAPTIHAGWGAWPITLEISNLGPFHLVLQEDDVIAQITVATISSIPERSMRAAGSVTAGQTNVGIQPPPPGNLSKAKVKRPK